MPESGISWWKVQIDRKFSYFLQSGQ